MKFNPKETSQEVLLAGSFAFFVYEPGWPQVCVILILAILINARSYLGKTEKSVDLQKLEEKIAKAHQDIKSINLRLGFSRA